MDIFWNLFGWILGGLLLATLLWLGFWVRNNIIRLTSYKKILDQLPIDIMALDSRNRHIYVNKRAIKDAEKREWIIGRTIAEYYAKYVKNADKLSMRMEMIENAWKSKEQTEWEEEFTVPGGKLHYIRRLQPVLNQHGKAEYIVGYGIDITSRVEIERLLEEKESIQESIIYFASSLFRQNTVEDILWDIAINCVEKLGFVDCVIYLLNHKRQILEQKAAHGPKNKGDQEIIAPIEIPLGKGIVGAVALSGEAELISDVSQDTRYILDDAQRYSELAVPIVSPEGRVLGVIDSEHPDKGFLIRCT